MQWCREIARYTKPGKILECGSYNVNGSVKNIFTSMLDCKSYLGIDITPGPNVDMVLNAHFLQTFFAPSEFDTILALEILEHDSHFWITLEGINYVLKSGGYLIISTPTTGFPEHKWPVDMYRFMEDAYRQVLFAGYNIIELKTVHDTVGNPGLVCIGQKL